MHAQDVGVLLAGQGRLSGDQLVRVPALAPRTLVLVAGAAVLLPDRALGTRVPVVLAVMLRVLLVWLVLWAQRPLAASHQLRMLYKVVVSVVVPRGMLVVVVAGSMVQGMALVRPWAGLLVVAWSPLRRAVPLLPWASVMVVV